MHRFPQCGLWLTRQQEVSSNYLLLTAGQEIQSTVTRGRGNSKINSQNKRKPSRSVKAFPIILDLESETALNQKSKLK